MVFNVFVSATFGSYGSIFDHVVCLIGVVPVNTDKCNTGVYKRYKAILIKDGTRLSAGYFNNFGSESWLCQP